MKKIKLKPCPFCNGEAKLIIDTESSVKIGVREERRYAMITCLNCGVRTPRILEDVEYCAVDKVREIWETRVGENNV